MNVELRCFTARRAPTSGKRMAARRAALKTEPMDCGSSVRMAMSMSIGPALQKDPGCALFLHGCRRSRRRGRPRARQEDVVPDRERVRRPQFSGILPPKSSELTARQGLDVLATVHSRRARNCSIGDRLLQRGDHRTTIEPFRLRGEKPNFLLPPG